LKKQYQVAVSRREVYEYYWLTSEEINQAGDSADWLKKYVALIISE
jgi:hypothetical protein